MLPYVGDIRMVAFNFAPSGWALCDGRVLSIEENEALYLALGTTFGGDDVSFQLPDLRGRVPIGPGHGDGLTDRQVGESGGSETVMLTDGQMPAHSHALAASQSAQSAESPAGSVPAADGPIEMYSPDGAEVALSAASVLPAGGSQPHDNVQPFLTINYIISLTGRPPSDPGPDDDDPFLAEIRLMAGDAVPAGWARCEGQVMPLPPNTMLFSVLGTQYGGNGRTTFALPDLRGAVAMCAGAGRGLSNRVIGESGGSDTTALLGSEVPAHSHALRAATAAGSVSQPSPATTLAASGGGSAYATSSDGLTALADDALAPSGGGAAHNNLQPYLGLNFCIALRGVYPQRD